MVAEPQAGAHLRFAGGGGRQHHAHALRALHYVRVGDDVAVGVHDHARSQAALPSDGAGLGIIFFVQRTIARHLHLHDGGRYTRRQFLQRFVELRQQILAIGFGRSLRCLRIRCALRRQGRGAQKIARAAHKAEHCARDPRSCVTTHRSSPISCRWSLGISSATAANVLSSRGEKIFQHRCRVFGQNSRGYFHAMIQLRMIQHRETRAHRAAFGVWSAVN